VTATIAQVRLARTVRELPPYRPGHWIVAGTPGWEPYPCVCWGQRCSYAKCPDRWRTEGDALPSGCCGRASGSHGERLEPAGGHSNAHGASSSKWKPRESGKQGWERSIGPEHQAAAVSRPLDGGAPVAGDLWAAPWDAEPAPWDLDGPDEASGSHGETPEAADGHFDGDGPARQHSEPSERRWDAEAELKLARARIWADQCDCPTPWDPPPAVLLVADTKDGPVRHAIALDCRRPEAREHATKALADRGWELAQPWADGRHKLLPPQGKLKTRPGLLADLVGPDSSRGHAVVDLPPEEAPGVHCIDCHLSFASNVAYQMHRPSWMQPCREPSKVVTVLHGMPMLLRDPAGLWRDNPDAVYGPRGRPVSRGQANDIWERGKRDLKRWRYGKGQNR
jgi:hypothetical protein